MLQRYPGTSIGARRTRPFGIPLVIPKAPPPEANPWWWNPGRPGVLGAPPDFARQLKEFDPDLAVTWNAYEERWYVWVRKPKLISKHCRGWLLLFAVRYTTSGAYMPLDNRVFARLYQASAAKWGNGLRYFDRVTAEIEREKDKRIADRQDAIGWMAGDYWKHTQPSVGYGPSSGSKFANNH